MASSRARGLKGSHSMGRDNFFQKLREREIGLGRRNRRRHDNAMFKILISSMPDCSYVLRKRLKSASNISIEDGLLLMPTSVARGRTSSNNRTTTSSDKEWGFYSLEVLSGGLLKQLCAFSEKRCLDRILIDFPAGGIPPGEGAVKPTLLTLSSDNYLRERDISDGAVINRVFLSQEYKFHQLNMDDESGTLYLKSTRTSTASQDSLLSFAIFDLRPLQFKALFEVKKSVFGKNVVDADCWRECLAISHSGNIIKVYSLAHILQQNEPVCTEYPHHYYLQQGVGDRGLPVTCQVDTCPPCLLQFESFQHSFDIDGSPFHCITRKSRKTFHEAEMYQVTRLVDSSQVGSFSGDVFDVEPDHVIFHPDGSNRILRQSSSRISILQLSEQDGKCSVGEVFKFIAKEHLKADEDCTPARKTNRSRRLRKAQQSHEFWDDSDAFDLTYAYNMDMDILGILTAFENDETGNISHIASIHLYDNRTGQLLRIIPIDMALKGSIYECNFELYICRAVIVVKVKTPQATEVLIYHLELTNCENTFEENTKNGNKTIA